MAGAHKEKEVDGGNIRYGWEYGIGGEGSMRASISERDAFLGQPKVISTYRAIARGVDVWLQSFISHASLRMCPSSDHLRDRNCVSWFGSKIWGVEGE